MERKHLFIIAALFIITFLFKAYYLDKAPLSEDEALYAEMIAEEWGHPTFLPTYFGYLAPWKPGLYFITYSYFLQIGSALFTSFEAAYRFPNLLFSALSAFLVYLIAKRFGGKDVGIIAALAFFCTPIAIHVETRLLIEPFMFPFLLASIYFYTKEKKTAADFLAAGAFAFITALCKYVIAMMIPLLALVYVFTSEKKTLRNPLFWISLLGAPLGLAIFFLALNSVGMGQDIFLIDAGRGMVYGERGEFWVNVLRNSSLSFSFLFLFLAAIVSLAINEKRPKIEPLFIAWACIFIFLISASTFRQWYLYYILPPLCFFAGIAIVEKKKADALSILFTVVFVAVSLATFALSFQEWEKSLYASSFEAKEIGLSLAGDNSTAFIGRHYTNVVSVCYKALEERRMLGEPLDFGYVLIKSLEGPPGFEKPAGQTNATGGGWDAYFLAFAQDYHAQNYTVEEENFAEFFWSDTTFRRKTPIEDFNTIVVSPPMNFTLEGYTRTFAGNYSEVYTKNPQ